MLNRLIWGSSSEVTAPRVWPHVPPPGTSDHASDRDWGPPRKPHPPIRVSASGSGRGRSRTHTKTNVCCTATADTRSEQSARDTTETEKHVTKKMAHEPVPSKEPRRGREQQPPGSGVLGLRQAPGLPAAASGTVGSRTLILQFPLRRITYYIFTACCMFRHELIVF